MADKIWIPVSGSNTRLWSPGAGAPGGGGSSDGRNAAPQQTTTDPTPASENSSCTPQDPVPPATAAGAQAAAAEKAADPTAPAAAPCPPESRPGGGEGAAASTAEVQALAEVQAQRDEYLEGLQRLKAEFENYRRRTRREMQEVSEHAKKGLLTEFLPVLDNLERALAAAEHHEEGNVLSGVRMTREQFLELLKRHGVEQIDPMGQPFDPAFHDAMLSQPSAEPEGTVFAVLEKGYKLGERIVRPARVAVSAGPDRIEE